MSIFSNLTNEGLEESTDRLGGFQVRATDIYLAKIKAAYAGQSTSGARNVTIVAELPDGEYSETIYVTNKKGENWFLNPNDKSKKVPLPGFTIIDDLCLATTGESLSEQDTEEKVVKIYDFEERRELPKAVPMLVNLIGTTVFLGIVHQTVDKSKRNESTGEYEPTGEVRDENVIEKIFHDPTKLTIAEARQSLQEPVFFDKWLAKNKGIARNKSKAADGGVQSGRPGGGIPQSGVPQSGTNTKKKTPSLFGKN